MKRIYLFAAAAALFAACSSEDVAVNDQQKQDQTEVANSPIGFDVYTQKATTRGGWAGSITTNGLKGIDGTGADLAGYAAQLSLAGFGVFGYYTNNNEYDQRSVPNFMYNQQVKWNKSTSQWEYKPIVYWPNEYGSNAESDDKDKLTFFAYAPWIQVIPTSGKLADTSDNAEEWGITGMTRNSNQGDPILKYIAQFRADRSVDLCWGVADNGDGTAWNTTETGVAQSPAIADGKPWIDLQRPASTNQKVKFTFKHATAQMRVNIDAEVDEVHGTTNEVAKKTRVWVREVTFKGFVMKGSLNLDNDDANKAKWLDYNGQNEIVAEDVTIYDGRKDGKEGVNGAIATNEKTLGLNPRIIQDGVYSDNAYKTVNETGHQVYKKGIDLTVVGPKADGTAPTTDRDDFNRPGVTTNPVNLFAQDATNKSNSTEKDAIFHVIPTDDPFEVEIVYDIETVSENLAQNLSDGATKGSSIENRIRQTVTFGSETNLKIGKSYTLNLHLGLNSVKVDADVTPWIEEAQQPVDLPLNTPIFEANTGTGEGSSASPYGVTIPYAGNYTFAISGLNGGESTTYAETVPLDSWSGSENSAWANGYALQTLTTVPNFKTVDRTHEANWKGNQSGYQTYFAFTQKAHPLFMKIDNVDKVNKTIILHRYNDASQTGDDHWTATGGWLCDGDGTAKTDVNYPDYYIKVWRNGVELDNSELNTTATSGNKFKFSDAGETDNVTAKITLLDTPQSDDVYKVELKTGDLPAETVTYKVP